MNVIGIKKENDKYYTKTDQETWSFYYTKVIMAMIMMMMIPITIIRGAQVKRTQPR